jgi:hypothetical protein
MISADILWGAKVLHFLGVDVESLLLPVEIAVWAKIDYYLH